MNKEFGALTKAEDKRTSVQGAGEHEAQDSERDPCGVIPRGGGKQKHRQDHDTGYGNDAFDWCNLLLRIKRWHPDLPSAIKNCTLKAIIMDELSLVPTKYRRAAAIGFAMSPGNDLSTDSAKAYMSYLSKNAEKICDEAINHPEILEFLCKNRLIKQKDIDTYLLKAKEVDASELIVMLQYYQSESKS